MNSSLTIVAVGAHPDDIELGCGGSLAYLISRGAKVINVIVTNGEKSGDSKIRKEEAIKAAKVIGVDKVYFIDLKDTHIQEDARVCIDFLEKINAEYNPGMVFTHSVKDVHQDHQATYNCSLIAFRRTPSILMYEIPGTFSSFAPSHFFDISDYLATKKEALDCYHSQNTKNFMEYQTVIDIASYRGRQCNIQLAEAFETVRFLSFL
ncbi:MAG: PIG-L deacetylase family protein [Nanoarchaeota archaeon]|nr:PIG-L deacetylase family protein [Nanoarchaeota archaeon]